ncbi:MAG: hypothetical protein MRT15_04170 [archaeon YNP-LCB-003-016]|uniref:hypothetical protein n=1 Tax=Candidatus Culexarchaeum yellowstonense TaxID=2928963 RepID=UPI0026EE2499|nr:hypothetical protein [Candidatus Culexarchaeum yellowstonense]MCR6691564.1 hypothetical protein [Candidatus Culexarchaeum yellowstonense]
MEKVIARQVCKVIRDPKKNILCVELLSKVLAEGEKVKDQVREEMRKNFNEEERRLIAEELKKIMG